MGPKFHRGEIVVIDPDAQVADQQYCLLQNDPEQAPCLRQYIRENDEHIEYKALNPDFPSFTAQSHEKVYGRAVYRGEFL
jgi:phage repressor protein C with HTH and peptisase S24 domain